MSNQDKDKKQEDVNPSDTNTTQPGKENQNLTQEDIPDSTNESTGVPGTGQRQDTN